ncbi:type II toxin-antitoxin system Phd/YefM family antitoxin [Cohnella sp.]|uniref:type II toxin-antitoxin system Phd/YefM family antitoxin n=1 Tax=Cohnella sp. TaxID=1883426 RepID=UPI003562DFC8
MADGNELDEPLIVTRNGEVDPVVVTHETYRSIEARIKLQSKLLVAEKQVADGEELVNHDEVITRMRRKLYAANECNGRY